MGQKTNPNIFRLGVTKIWKTEFFEKKRQELPIYTFKDLEIKAYIQRFLELQGLFLHDYKQHFSNSTLNLYISYIILPEFIMGGKGKRDIIVLTTASGHKKIVFTGSQQLKLLKKSDFKLSFNNDQNRSELYKIKTYLNVSSDHLRVENQINFQLEQKEILDLKVEGILSNFFKVLSLFTRNKFNIIINFCCLNKTSSFLKNTQKKNFILLQKFKATPFLKEGIELLFHVVHNRASANLLAKFIASQMKKIKRHKFFLSFLKQTLTVLLSSKFSILRGVRVMVKGRLNGVPRAKHKIISIGDVPVQNIDANVDYSQVTIHNSNGSYGIRVWIIEKTNDIIKQICFYNQEKRSLERAKKED